MKFNFGLESILVEKPKVANTSAPVAVKEEYTDTDINILGLEAMEARGCLECAFTTLNVNEALVIGMEADGTFGEKVGAAATRAKNALVSAIIALWNFAVKGFNYIVALFRRNKVGNVVAVEPAKAALTPEIYRELHDEFNKATPEEREAFKNPRSAKFKAIKDRVLNKIKGLIRTIIDAIKSVFKKDKKTEVIAKEMEENATDLEKDVEKAANDVVDTLAPTVEENKAETTVVKVKVPVFENYESIDNGIGFALLLDNMTLEGLDLFQISLLMLKHILLATRDSKFADVYKALYGDDIDSDDDIDPKVTVETTEKLKEVAASGFKFPKIKLETVEIELDVAKKMSYTDFFVKVREVHGDNFTICSAHLSDVVRFMTKFKDAMKQVKKVSEKDIAELVTKYDEKAVRNVIDVTKKAIVHFNKSLSGLVGLSKAYRESKDKVVG